MKKGVLAVGTIIVILNILLATGAFTLINWMVGQFQLQQKLVVLDQGIRIQCNAITRDSLNEEYSKRGQEPDSLASVQLLDFYKEEIGNYESEIFSETDVMSVRVCSGSPNEIIKCQLELQKELDGDVLMMCDTITYHPHFVDSSSRIIFYT